MRRHCDANKHMRPMCADHEKHCIYASHHDKPNVELFDDGGQPTQSDNNAVMPDWYRHLSIQLTFP